MLIEDHLEQVITNCGSGQHDDYRPKCGLIGERVGGSERGTENRGSRSADGDRLWWVTSNSGFVEGANSKPTS